MSSTGSQYVWSRKAESSTGGMCVIPPSVQVLPDCDGPSALIVAGNGQLGALRTCSITKVD